MIVILGNGGHSRVLMEALNAQLRILRYKPHEVSSVEFHSDFDNIEKKYPRDSFKLVNGVGSMGARKTVYNYIRTKTYENPKIIHPSAVVSRDEGRIFGDGLQVMAGALIQPGCKIGHNVLINTGAQIDHDCIIGDHCHIAPGAILCGGVTVGEGAFIGAGAVIPEGRKIPDNAFVPAGTVFK